MTASRENILDTRGLLCPRPIIDMAQATGEIGEGEELVILSDDAAFPLDLRAWCAGTGHELLDLTSSGNEHRATIRKRSKV
jgi:cysteine desulfurase